MHLTTIYLFLRFISVVFLFLKHNLELIKTQWIQPDVFLVVIFLILLKSRKAIASQCDVSENQTIHSTFTCVRILRLVFIDGVDHCALSSHEAIFEDLLLVTFSFQSSHAISGQVLHGDGS